MTPVEPTSGLLRPELLVALLEADHDLLVLVDEHGDIAWTNPALAETLGWGRGRFRALGPHLIHAADRADFDAALAVARADVGGHHVGDVRCLAVDGSYVPTDLTVTNLLDGHGVLLLRHRDLRGAGNGGVDGPIPIDEVTRLPQRAVVRRALERRLGATTQQVAVLFCDLDGFKAVNDRFGHAAGDAVLVEVAERLQRRLRDTELLARWGGDEFVVLVDVPGPALATTVAARLHTAVADQAFDVDGSSISLGLSVGVALGSARSRADGLVAEADRAMYAAKRSGGGIVVASAA